jgi:hypothetical protein
MGPGAGVDQQKADGSLYERRYGGTLPRTNRAAMSAHQVRETEPTPCVRLGFVRDSQRRGIERWCMVGVKAKVWLGVPCLL